MAYTFLEYGLGRQKNNQAVTTVVSLFLLEYTLRPLRMAEKYGEDKTDAIGFGLVKTVKQVLKIVGLDDPVEDDQVYLGLDCLPSSN